MDDYEIENLEQESLVVIVTSTFGNGEGPDNGKVGLFYVGIIQNNYISVWLIN